VGGRSEWTEVEELGEEGGNLEHDRVAAQLGINTFETGVEEDMRLCDVHAILITHREKIVTLLFKCKTYNHPLCKDQLSEQRSRSMYWPSWIEWCA